jgi:hypothetical protein
MHIDNNSQEIRKAHQESIAHIQQQLAPYGLTEAIPQFLLAMANARDGVFRAGSAEVDFNPIMKSFRDGELARANAIARSVRKDWRNPGARQYTPWRKAMSEGMAKSTEIAKAALDVGSLTNLANVTGGQALSLVSMDTRMARGTVRPKSFTLYNALNKSMAGQIVDYWAYASDVGGGLPGTVYSPYSSATSGNAITSNSGSYNLNYLNLKLTVDGRAITMALAQQNNFVNVADQESTNAALNTLTSIEWAIYWGNPALYPNMPQGIAGLIPTNNVVDFWAYYNSAPIQALGISVEQALFNLIYQQAGFISGWRQFGQITHAFMTPAVMGDMQSIVTGVLRTITNDITDTMRNGRAIVVDGELRGMNTSFGDIAFPIDFFMTVRDTPAQAQLHENSNTDFTVSTLPAPTLALSVVASGNTNAAGSEFYGAYTPTATSGGSYYYAVAAADQYSNESALGFSASAVTGVTANTAVAVVITPGAGSVAANVVAFRVFRSGVGFAGTVATWTNATNPNGSFPNPASFKFVGDLAANGASAVTFYDLNARIPGSESIFLLDMDESDDAIDWRTMLPITKVELFAQNIFMPWAVCSIGSVRLRVPKFHGRIRNYVPATAQWNPTSTNANAQPLI